MAKPAVNDSAASGLAFRFAQFCGLCYIPLVASSLETIGMENGMAYVTPREGETPESLVNRFRASVQHAGILRELKDRRFFRSKAQKERLAAQRAARRRRRQRR